MKTLRFLFFGLLLLGSTLSMSAQTDKSSGTETVSFQKYMYCEIVGNKKFMSNKLNITLDFGQAQKWLADNRLTDDNGKIISFNSMMDALNYMGKRGWKLVHAYTLPISETESQQRWILERPFDKEMEPTTRSAVKGSK